MNFKYTNLTKKQKIAIVLSLVIVGSIGAMAIKSNIEQQIVQEDVIGEIEDDVEIYTLPGKEKIFFNGEIKPISQEEIFEETDNGEIDKIYVLDGQIVSKGDNLLRYKNEDKVKEVEEVKEEILDLEKERKEEVSKVDEEGNKIGDTSEIDKELKKLKKEKDKLENEIYTKIKAPFEGRIHINKQEYNSENSLESSQNLLMTIQSLDYQLQSLISENDLYKVNKKDSVNISIFATKENRSGYIKYISKNPTNQSNDYDYGSENLSYYDIVIAFDEQHDLTNGFHAQAVIEKEISSFKIPSTAIIKENNKNYVYAIIDGIAKKKEVVIEEDKNKNKAFTTVTSGLKEETSIIRYPNENTTDGMEVQINEEINEEMDIELEVIG